MNSVRIDKHRLLGTVQENREKHRQVFEEAQVGYRKMVIKELDAMLQEARGGKRIRRRVELDEPVDQTHDYDRVIAMLEMSVDEVVELDETAFANYVLDDWDWTQRFLTTNSTYSARARQRLR